MAHEITATDRIILARIPAWHRLGTVLDNAFTWSDALKGASLNWNVEKRQLLDPIAKLPIDRWGIFRVDTGDYMGDCGKDYTPLQNYTIGQVMDAIVEAEGGAHYDVAGSIRGGKQVWAQIALRDAIRIKGTDDKSDVRLTGIADHSGKLANRWFTSATRIVCANTMRIAELNQDKMRNAEFRITHSGDVDLKIANVRKTLTEAHDGVKSFNDKLNFLATREANMTIVKEFVQTYFPRVIEDADGKHSATQRTAARKVLENFESNDSNAIPKVKGTAYNLYNAVTEWADHSRGGVRKGTFETTEQARAFGAVLGAGNTLKQVALDSIMELVQSGPKSKSGAGVDKILSMVA